MKKIAPLIISDFKNTLRDLILIMAAIAPIIMVFFFTFCPTLDYCLY